MPASADEDELPKAGELLDGRYRVKEVLGAGGMGTVLAARHEQMGHDVAIKVMAASAAKDAKKVERFKREAWAAAKIKSDHVARVLNVGELTNGVPFMVLELLHGEDLYAVLKKRLLTVPEAVDYVMQACEALAEAHAAGIVHRDLKPSNLFLTHRPDGKAWIKVLDFGISKHATGMQLTKTRSLMGSPLYMAPEQMASSKKVDPRSDVWSIGVILYELVSGHTPFEGETLPEICTRVLHSPPTPLRDHLPGVPAGFGEVLVRFLTKKPEERLQHLGEVADVLEAWGTAEAAASATYVRSVLGHTRPVAPVASTTLVHGGVSTPTVAPRTVTMDDAPPVRPSAPDLPMVSALHDDDEDDEPTRLAVRHGRGRPQVAAGATTAAITAAHGSWTPHTPHMPHPLQTPPGEVPIGASTHTTMTTEDGTGGGRRGLIGGVAVAVLLLTALGFVLWLGRDVSEGDAASAADPTTEPSSLAVDEDEEEPDEDSPADASATPAASSAPAAASGPPAASSLAPPPRPPPPPPPVIRPPPPKKGWDPFEGR